MDCHGRMLAHVLLHESDGILSMSWNYPIFLVEDSSESDTDSDDYSPPQGNQLAALPFIEFGKRTLGKRVTSLREGGSPYTHLSDLLERAFNAEMQHTAPPPPKAGLPITSFLKITGSVDFISKTKVFLDIK